MGSAFVVAMSDVESGGCKASLLEPGRYAQRRRGRSGREVDEDLFSRESLDPLTEGGIIDTVPESATDLSRSDLSKTDRAKLREFLQRAEQIGASDQDSKIEKAVEIILDWLKKGHHPIVFCRFVATAKYVAEQLQERIKDKYPAFRATAVSGETGGDEEHEAAIWSSG